MLPKFPMVLTADKAAFPLRNIESICPTIISTDFSETCCLKNGCSALVSTLKHHTLSFLFKVLEVKSNNESNYNFLCGASVVKELFSNPTSEKSWDVYFGS